MSITVSDLILQSYVEVNVIQDTSETISTTLRDNAFLLLQQAYSSLSLERLIAYLVVHQTFSMVAGTSSYTLGTGGTLVTGALPVAVTGWASVSGSFRNGGVPVSFDAIRDAAKNPTGRTSVLAEMVAADQANPSIGIEVFPTPATSPGTLTLDYWTPLVQFTSVAQTISLPDGFELFLRLLLATHLETRYPLESGPRQELARNYLAAKTAIQGRVASILGIPQQAA